MRKNTDNGARDLILIDPQICDDLPIIRFRLGL